jgi:hypothetical protein
MTPRHEPQSQAMTLSVERSRSISEVATTTPSLATAESLAAAG